MDLFEEQLNCFLPLNIFPKSSILDIWQDLEYASVLYVFKVNKKNTRYALFIVNCDNIYHNTVHIY